MPGSAAAASLVGGGKHLLYRRVVAKGLLSMAIHNFAPLLQHEHSCKA